MSGAVCVTGRFQPPHHQHLELFEHALARGERLIVAVTNPDPGARRAEATSEHRHTSEANPFTFYERARLLQVALAARGAWSQTTVVPFDLTRPAVLAEYVPLDALQLVRAYGDWERRKAQLLRDAGYAVEVLDAEPAGKLAASDVRRLLRDDGAWREAVPPATVGVLEELLARRSMRARVPA